MIAFAKKWLGFDIGENEAREKYILELDKLEEQIEKSKIIYPSNVPKPALPSTAITDTDKTCVLKTGLITQVSTNHGMIDKHLIFDLECVNPGFDVKVGLKVKYLAHKPEHSDNLKVIKITEIINNYWDVQPTENNIQEELEKLANAKETLYAVHQRSVSGVVTHRDKHMIKINTEVSEIDVDLDSIDLKFIPQVCDRVYLNCNVQTDESFLDCAGEVVEVTDIYPTRSKTIKSGRITSLGEYYGIVEKECFFTFEVLSKGYKPSIQDVVAVEAIECEMDEFMWRCTEVVLLEKSTAVEVIVATADDQFYANKNGITITNRIRFKADDMHSVVEETIVISNEGDIEQRLDRVFFKIKKRDSQINIKTSPKETDLIVKPGDHISYVLECRPKFFGYNEEIIVFAFDRFKIARKIIIEVGISEKEPAEMNYSNKFKASKLYAHQVWSRKCDIVAGEKTFTRPRFVATKIGTYDVPERMKKVVLSEDHSSDIKSSLETLFPSLSGSLKYVSYSNRFQTMLHLEEIKLYLHIRQYDMNRAHFHRVEEFLALEIENLTERRPSLMIGDTIICSNPWADRADDRCFEGVIHKVQFDRILLKFNSGFHSAYNGEDYRVQFQFSRFGLRKQHFAVNKVFNEVSREFLFPTKLLVHARPQTDIGLTDDGILYLKDTGVKLKWYNPNLNEIQKIAVRNVLRGEAKTMPYVIYGPPGTGKTMTLVEIIIQIMKVLPNSRIIVATPSNSSANLIATRLVDSNALKPGDFVRLVSINSIEKDLIPDNLKAYCATVDLAVQNAHKDDSMIVSESGMKLRCSMQHIGRHKITIGTCSTLGLLMMMGFKPGHFTHVLVDEAGQCTESETMIPICQLSPNSGQVVLAGDPQQLGPTVLDAIADEKGLGISFLERLLQTPPYIRDKLRHPETGFEPKLVTKLLYNYRSLPSIMKSYSELFYDSDLKAVVDDTNSNEAKLLAKLQEILPENTERKLTSGAFFVGVRGISQQEKDSPSWYNLAEAKQIFLFVIRMYQKGFKASDIGIITPYNKQVRKIRNVFNEAEIDLPKVGSVEEFQGQERNVILVSTVRSSRVHLRTDAQQCLGFVNNAKRMNVTISRARALLIIFGNPHLLRMDKNWREYIKYCCDSNCYAGCALD